MDKLDRFMYERMNDVQALAGRQQLQSFLAAPPAGRTSAAAAALTKQLQDYQATSGIWSNLTILDSKGSLALPGADPQKLAASLAKQVSILRLYTAAALGKTGYSDAISVEAGREPVMLFMAPVRNQLLSSQPIIGVMVGEISWHSSLEIMDGLKTTTAVLINQNGLSLGDNHTGASKEVLTQNFAGTPVFQAIQRSEAGTGVLPGLDDTQQSFLTAYAPEKGYRSYKGNHWTLVLQTPTKVAFAPVQRLTKSLILIYLTLVIAATVVLIILLEQQIIRPITLLKDVANKVAEGNFSKQVAIRSRDELGQLGRVFNAMITKLQAARQDLAARTEQAESEESLMRTLLHSLPVGVAVVRASDREPILMNPLGEKLSGHNLAAPEGDKRRKGYVPLKEDGSVYPASQYPVTLAIKGKRPVAKDDIVMQRPDGSSLAVRVTAAPIKELDGHIERAVSVFEDITEERQLQRSRDEFFNIASHELRTPLTAIRGNSEMIQKMYGDKLTEPELVAMVEDIHEASTRLIDIVNDFLDTSRLEQKRMTFELQPFDIAANAQSVIKEYQVTGSRQKTHLEVVVPSKPLPQVMGDSNRVKQVIINLVGNALKFTEKGTVTISFEIESHQVKVLVTDTGRGMPLEAQRALFKKFGQSKSGKIAVNSARSTGLGLYISKLIVEQLHGRIRLEWSELGKGTCFSFTLPVAPAKTA